MSRVILLFVVACTVAVAIPAQTLAVGSKKFTESVVLGEMVRLLAERAGAQATHRQALGGTRILFEALRSGEIDVYPEYTGTLRLEILAQQDLKTDAELHRALAKLGLKMSAPLGFANSYGVAAKAAWAEQRGLSKLSDLARHPGLALGCSNEFLGRGDGFLALQKFYGLRLKARGMDHDLAYAGIAGGSFPLIVVYTTEPEIQYYGLRVLDDDRGFFPNYQAVLLYRTEHHDAPVMQAVLRLCGRISSAEMIGLNLAAKPPRNSGRDSVAENVVADRFLAREFGTAQNEVAETWQSRLFDRTAEQLLLVCTSMFLAILIAVPLGVLAARRAVLGQALLAVGGILQTLPSLALLVFLIPWFGLGAVPAIVALFVYSLLPILRNTHSGLTGIAPELTESARALGLTPNARLFSIELPLALPAIFAGIKTAAVINIGTATLGAFIDAGGYGLPILTGIRLDDYNRVLQGAVPAAVMAILAQLLLDALERRLVSRGLR